MNTMDKILRTFSAAVLVGAAVMLTSCASPENSATQEQESSSGLIVYTTETETSAAVTETETETTVTKADKTSAQAEETETDETETSAAETSTESWTDYDDSASVSYHFRSKKLLDSHFEKHGGEFADDFGYKTADEYEQGASDVINNPDALYKTEAEDGDGVYYIESTNEFVVLSTDGYIRTYFRPDSGIKYFNKQ